MITADFIEDRVSSLTDDDFNTFWAQQDPPSIEEINAFQKDINCQFPSDFLSFISTYWNGFYLEADQSVWPEVQGGAYWMFQYGLLVFGLDSELPDWVNLRDFVKIFRDDYNTSLTPCMKTRWASQTYCFNSNGELYLLEHDTRETTKLNKTFFEAFEDELKVLQSNKEKAKKESLK